MRKVAIILLFFLLVSCSSGLEMNRGQNISEETPGETVWELQASATTDTIAKVSSGKYELTLSLGFSNKQGLVGQNYSMELR